MAVFCLNPLSERDIPRAERSSRPETQEQARREGRETKAREEGRGTAQLYLQLHVGPTADRALYGLDWSHLASLLPYLGREMEGQDLLYWGCSSSQDASFNVRESTSGGADIHQWALISPNPWAPIQRRWLSDPDGDSGPCCFSPQLAPLA